MMPTTRRLRPAATANLLLNETRSSSCRISYRISYRCVADATLGIYTRQEPSSPLLYSASCHTRPARVVLVLTA
jgi:hypothetical protein